MSRPITPADFDRLGATLSRAWAIAEWRGTYRQELTLRERFYYYTRRFARFGTPFPKVDDVARELGLTRAGILWKEYLR